MAPNNITREHVLMAFDIIDQRGVPLKGEAKGFLIEYNEKYYPQKYSLGLANQLVNGKELHFVDFNAVELS